MEKYKAELSSSLIFIIVVAVAATAANNYYNQPLLPSIADSFGISFDLVGYVPAATQLGYALALFFISPLGDKLNRKVLIRFLSIGLVLSLFLASIAVNIYMLILASLLIGIFANITQQLIPLAASLSNKSSRGRIIGIVMTGLTIGLLCSRTISGFVGEHFGWRTMFLVAAAIAAVIGGILAWRLPATQPSTNERYAELIKSMLRLFNQLPELRQAAVLGALWFAAFNSLWATLAMHVTSEPFLLSTQQAGLFGLVGLAGAVGARRAGIMADRYGTNPVISLALLMILSAFVCLYISKSSIIGLVIGVIMLDLGVFVAQIPNQARVFSLNPEARSRINGMYMLVYYLAGALGSYLGAAAYAYGGWTWSCWVGLVCIVLGISVHFKQQKMSLSLSGL
ncbi:MFS transporter [Spartinivicinus ruber]|uniref:MFS transporter n=1 Tax=Spartinivicinus ruber TaxID=2683272 RepID=UPI0013D6D0B8|nr:MFS transporter [Spartinivicinus ruber]